jgi:Arc/MetJ-type ribon-helix-helix transcriptional regulator
MEVTPEIAEKINEQVRRGKYKSPQDFFLAAIQNQLYYEEEPSVTAARIVESGHTGSTSAESVMMSLTSNIHLLSDRPDAETVRTVPVSNLPRSDYLWGQYNRFLPVKVVTRVASNLVKRYSTDHIPLAELQETCAQIARELGKDLERKDRQLGRKRGTIIAAGFPIGRDQNKSTLRFSNQFVGYLAKQPEPKLDRVEGAAPVLKFIELKRDENNSVTASMTAFGVKFASLTNPVIDLKNYANALSEEEAMFILEHIQSQLPTEAKLIHLVLTAVKEGIATPVLLNDRVGKFNPDWKEGEVSTMRSGIVSRIRELGLLTVEKDGVKVTYKLTKSGDEYLNRLNSRRE